jgi:hypothetical protein
MYLNVNPGLALELVLLAASSLLAVFINTHRECDILVYGRQLQTMLSLSQHTNTSSYIIG